MCCWCDVLCNTFYARPCNFHSVLIKLCLVKKNSGVLRMRAFLCFLLTDHIQSAASQ